MQRRTDAQHQRDRSPERHPPFLTFGDATALTLTSSEPALRWITPSDGQVHASEKELLAHLSSHYPRLLVKHPHVDGWWQVCILWTVKYSAFRVFRNDKDTVQCLRDLCVVAVLPCDEDLWFDLHEYLSDLIDVYRLHRANISLALAWLRVVCRDCVNIQQMYHRCWAYIMSFLGPAS